MYRLVGCIEPENAAYAYDAARPGYQKIPANWLRQTRNFTFHDSSIGQKVFFQAAQKL